MGMHLTCKAFGFLSGRQPCFVVGLRRISRYTRCLYLSCFYSCFLGGKSAVEGWLRVNCMMLVRRHLSWSWPLMSNA